MLILAELLLAAARHRLAVVEPRVAVADCRSMAVAEPRVAAADCRLTSLASIAVPQAVRAAAVPQPEYRPSGIIHIETAEALFRRFRADRGGSAHAETTES